MLKPGDGGCHVRVGLERADWTRRAARRQEAPMTVNCLPTLGRLYLLAARNLDSRPRLNQPQRPSAPD